MESWITNNYFKNRLGECHGTKIQLSFRKLIIVPISEVKRVILVLGKIGTIFENMESDL